jgi:hypothetical protein
VTSTISSLAVSFSRISVYGYCVGKLDAAANSRVADKFVIELERVVFAAVEL